MFVSAFGSGITAFLLWGFADTLARVFAFAIIFGGLSGGFSSIAPIGSSDCVGNKPEQARVAYGIVLLLKGAAVVVGPIVSSVLYDAGSAAYSAGNIASYGSFGFGPMECSSVRVRSQRVWVVWSSLLREVAGRGYLRVLVHGSKRVGTKKHEQHESFNEEKRVQGDGLRRRVGRPSSVFYYLRTHDLTLGSSSQRSS
ncbi:hypothetical protein B0H21DRAFT_367850 [Amylocystis lapponica]|nr:hypothetical protein B0H21DRAFT_367850 [Amylocystis lapponica]